MVAPGIGTWLDADELVIALCVRDTAAGAREVGIERRVMLINDVTIAAGGIALPDLDKGIGYRPPTLVKHAALDDDALAQGLAGVLLGEICLLRRHIGVAIDRPRDLRQRLRDDDQRSVRRTRARAHVVRGKIGRVGGVAGAGIDVIHVAKAPCGWNSLWLGLPHTGVPSLASAMRVERAAA